MSRNVNGTYTLPPAVNPVEPGTVIAVDWANPTLNDVAQALTESLDRNGRGAMLAPLALPTGSPTNPALKFVDNQGLYRSGTNESTYVAGGQPVFVFSGNKAISRASIGAASGLININVQDFGAKGNGSDDDTNAIQSAINHAQTHDGGIVYMPPGKYKISANLSITWPAPVKKTTLQGAGPGASIILDYRPGDPVGGAVSVDFSAYGTGGIGARYFSMDIGGFSIIKMVNATTANPGTGIYTFGTGNGLYLNMVAFTGKVIDLALNGHYTSVKAIDTLAASYDGLDINGCYTGLESIMGIWSPPNITTVTDSTFAACANWGMYTNNGAPINVANSTFQACGRMSQPQPSGGLGYAGGDIYAVGMNVNGCYFEDGRGYADIAFFDPAGVNEVATNTVQGCSFIRLSNTFYVTNNIYVYNATVGARVTVNVIGCGFGQASGYTPSASRKYIDVGGDTTAMKVYALGNMYENATETPTATIEIPAAAPTTVQQVGGMRKYTASSAVTVDTTPVNITGYDVTAFTTPVGITGTLATGALVFSKAGNYSLMVDLLCTYTPNASINRAMALEIWNVTAAASLLLTFLNMDQYSGTRSLGFPIPLTISPTQVGQSIVLRVGGNGGSTIAGFVVNACTFAATSVGPV